MTPQSSEQLEASRKYCPKCLGQYEGEVETCPNDGSALRGAKNDPLLGTTFAERYEILSVIGFGGMSIVYKARHKLIGRIVAIKMLHGYLREDVSALERFKLEAQAASSLNHPNIITVYDFGVTDRGEPFLIMDFLAGENLRSRLKRDTKMRFQEAVPIFCQIAEGLLAAHKKGIVHRDMKPANIFLVKQPDQRLIVKILDFGLAKVRNVSMTRPGEVYGSPLYMSPEQCLGKPPDSRSDIYSLGCVMYEVLCGKPPLEGENAFETMNLHVGKRPISIHFHFKESMIPENLADLIDSCLEKDPEDRPQDCSDVLQILSHLYAGDVRSGEHRLKKPNKESSGRRTKHKQLSPAAVALSITLGFNLLFISWYCLWPGPATDRGTMLEKLSLQLQLEGEEDAIKAGDYPAAEQLLLKARETSSKFKDDNFRLEHVLGEFARLYLQWEGHASDLERINKAINTLVNNRIIDQVDRELATLDDIAHCDDTEVSREVQRLRMVAQVPAEVALAQKLIGRSFLREASRLLSTATAVGAKLLPDDSENLAELEGLYGRTLEMRRDNLQARVHFQKSCEIYRKCAGRVPVAFAFSLSNLGQFDVNHGDFASAEKELDEALTIARENKAVEAEMLTLRSLSDLKHQTVKSEEWKHLMDEAERLNADFEKASLRTDIK